MKMFTETAQAVPPRLAYYAGPLNLPATVLGAVVFGRDSRAEVSASHDSRLVGVPLEAMVGSVRVEAWHTQGEVTSGAEDGVRFSASADHLFGVIEVSEASHGGPRGAAREAYERLARFHSTGRYPFVWRIWNFIDDINEGDGDDERYRLFCQGRAEAMGERLRGYPAGSALGRRDGNRILQVIWLAGCEAGSPVENPRQVSAYRYPRQYGPASPSFARAIRIGRELLISGTASIVGHETMHSEDVVAQLHESIENLRAVAGAASLARAQLAGFKAYVRHAGDADAIAKGIQASFNLNAPACMLLADICRRDLLVELEAVCLT